jgi:hypothetical protein
MSAAMWLPKIFWQAGYHFLICRIDVAGIQVDGRSGQLVGEKTSRRYDAPVTNRQQSLASIASRVAGELAIPAYVPTK